MIALPGITDPSTLPSAPVITAVTLAELSVGPLVAARALGQVAASLRRSGRKVGARSYDAMIAAIALANDLAVYTCNPADFEGIEGLTVVTVPPPTPQLLH